jgi:hypothetical protein
MKDKKTVFVLGAGASCPYGYPSGAHLREHICLSTGHPHLKDLAQAIEKDGLPSVGDFKKTFESSSTKSIDLFMTRNPKLAPVGKYIIAFEIFKAEGKSQFRERARRTQDHYKQAELRGEVYLLRKDFQGDDWYLYLFGRLTEGIVVKDALPYFSDGTVSFVTFNYDRSLEYFIYESFRKSFTEVPEYKVIQCLRNLKILHLYGQVAPLKWQDSNEGVDYRPQISESLLRKVSSNIRTIYEEKQNPELVEAQNLLKRADEIFFLGFGFAPENMDVLGLTRLIPKLCKVYGTAYGLEQKEIDDIRDRIVKELPGGCTDHNYARTKIENVDCLKLLRNHL